MEAQAPPIPTDDTAAPVSHELPRTDTGLRVLYSLVFAAILHIVIAMITVLVAIQIVTSLVTRRRPHHRLGRFGAALARYGSDVFGYLTFNRERPPFPFDDLEDDRRHAA